MLVVLFSSISHLAHGSLTYQLQFESKVMRNMLCGVRSTTMDTMVSSLRLVQSNPYVRASRDMFMYLG